MLQYFPNITGSLTVTGSVLISGSLTATQGITISGSIASASYALSASNASLLDGLNSSSFAPSSTFNTVSSSFASTSGSIASRVTLIEGQYATTGSNAFNGSQNITGSLTVSSQIVAQTLNVQQVTSSIVYSSGSNKFGNLLTDVQQFTGSLRVTGSGNNYFLGGNVGIGTTSPVRLVDVSGSAGVLRVQNGGSVGAPSIEIGVQNQGSGLFAPAANTIAITTNDTERLRITSGGNLQVTGSAFFSSSVQVNSYQIINGVAAGTSTYLQFNNNGSAIGYVGSAAAINSGAASSIALGVASGAGLTIASTGAATFSSSVSVGGYLTGQGTNPGGLGGSRYVIDFNSERTRLFTYGSNASTNGNFLFNSQRSDGTNSVDIMYLSGNGNVGIGTNSPNGPLDVVVGASGARRLLINYDDNLITIKGSAANAQPETLRLIGDGIRFNLGSSGSGTEIMRITSDGYLRLASKGIQFNGDTADANSLDDYEEGTWTPTWSSTGGTLNTNTTYTTGTYTKIGNVVHIWARLYTNSVSSPTGEVTVSGLPFTVGSQQGNKAMHLFTMNAITGTLTGTPTIAFNTSNTTATIFNKIWNSSEFSGDIATYFDNDTWGYFYGTYTV